MSNNKIFPKGIMAFTPHANAPDFVLASVIISPKELMDWMQGDGKEHMRESERYGEQLKLTITKTRDGKRSIEVDTYKKGQ